MKKGLDNKLEKGFTLLELMITVMVIGILVGFAVPAYQGYLEQARRSQVQVELLNLSQDLERFYNTGMTYTGFTIDSSELILPKGSSDPFYQIEVNISSDGQSFELMATPSGIQSEDECGELSVNSRGEKGYEGSTGGGCWK